MSAMLIAIVSAVILAAPARQGGAARPAPEDRNAPGPEHAILGPLAGSWDVTISFPDGRGGLIAGRAACEAGWTFDGRFLRMSYRSSFGGRPLEVVRYLGFDRHRARYVEVHFESTHTDVLHSEGAIDAGARTLTAVGTHVDVLAGRPATVRTVTTIAGSDAFTLEMVYLDDAGRPARTVTLEHRRAR
jgi:hypothetical protein